MNNAITYRKTDDDNFVRILSGKLKSAAPVYSGGIEQLTAPLDIDFVPAVKVFFTTDAYPRRLFTTPVIYFDPGISTKWNPYALFTLAWWYAPDDKSLHFDCTNRDTVVRTFEITYQIFSARGFQRGLV